MIVWVIEKDDYFVGVASSLAAAVYSIKRTYQAPYIVEWEDPEQESDGCWYMIGHFEVVLNYSTKHDVQYDFTIYPLSDIQKGAP